jgi:hypothetical protein
MSTINQVPSPYVAADSTGKIVVTGTIPQFMIAIQVPPTGGSIVEGVGDPATQYVADGAIVARPTNPSTISGMTISNVPNPSTVTIDGANPQTVTDGTVDLSFTQPATYTVVVSSWPYLDATFSVTQS